MFIKNKVSVARIVLVAILIVGIFGIYPVQAGAVDFGWAGAMGGTNLDSSYAIAVDQSGNVYTSGVFFGTADFDPGAGTFNMTSNGSVDIFISKLDMNGNFVWAKSMGGIGLDHGYAIAVDGSGNVYTTGHFNGTVDFDPGAGTNNLTGAGASNVFIQKLDTDGNFVWAKAIDGNSDGTTKDIKVFDIAMDGSGNVYTLGNFLGTVDFDPGVGTLELTSAGGTDIFISKLDNNGDFVFAKSVGGTDDDYGEEIALDGNGNILTTGYFSDTVDFDT